MTRYSFLDDYSEGAHPAILKALADTNLVQQTACGNDSYGQEARALLRSHMGKADPDIWFVASGTLVNILCISSALRPHEAVMCSGTTDRADYGARKEAVMSDCCGLVGNCYSDR